MAVCSFMITLVFGLFCSFALAQHPNYPPTWVMNASTIIMPCNYSGFTDPATTTGWGLIDFDWSNAKQFWAKAKPMDCAELLLKQVQITTEASPGTTVYVYRNSIKALPWYTSVRLTLNDPAYARWFLTFDPKISSYHVPTCDNNYTPPLCSKYYHDQSQTPEYPNGDGDCAAPACDVGNVPVGEYIWDPRSWNVSVNGKTFGDWFINDYLFDETGGANPKVSGFFFDDQWTLDGPTEYEPHASEDMGLSKQDLVDLTNAYWSNMAEVYQAVLARGKFSWQQLWTGQGTDNIQDIGTTCPGPLVSQGTCASDLRSLCMASSRAQSRFMMYAFSPGRCSGDPSVLTQFDQDLANFLLVRGKYAALGHGWLGCSRKYSFPDSLNKDYGEPLELCHEVSNGVFERKWSKAVVQMNCNTWTPSITFSST